jgi:hypothetical protein
VTKGSFNEIIFKITDQDGNPPEIGEVFYLH